ncbi:hypothetical protein [Oricola indica]|uniref:hypothetical protein n=1 Tax=Oricola indica TaxID=2872591 RepID=UPI003CCC1041
MAKAARKTELTREELQAQLEALDKQDTVAQRDAEIATLKEEIGKVTRERNTLSQQVTDLSGVIQTIHKTLSPFRDALDNAPRGGLYRGRRHAPRPRPVVTQGCAEVPQVTEAETSKPAATGKGIAAYFPSLSDDGPSEVVEAVD